MYKNYKMLLEILHKMFLLQFKNIENAFVFHIFLFVGYLNLS